MFKDKLKVQHQHPYCIIARFTEADAKRLEQAAKEKQQSCVGLIRDAVKAYIDKGAQ